VHDLDIRFGRRRAIPEAPSSGRLLARLELRGASSSLTAQARGYTLRIHGRADFELDASLRLMRVHLAHDAEEEIASLLMESALATVLALSGQCVLHASAVQTDGRAVGFMGSSGMGKTTLAAQCCAAGARILSDDVLRVEVADGRAWCFSGSSELRLRAAAAELAASLTASARRSTVDERQAVRPPAAAPGRHPIGALVVPICDRDLERARIERLRGPDAVRELVRFPRTLGWIDGERARRDFAVLAALAELVPVYRATLPWGPPFDPDVAHSLLGAVPVA
jgi:hypothetical protein